MGMPPAHGACGKRTIFVRTPARAEAHATAARVCLAPQLLIVVHRTASASVSSVFRATRGITLRLSGREKVREYVGKVLRRLRRPDLLSTGDWLIFVSRCFETNL